METHPSPSRSKAAFTYAVKALILSLAVLTFMYWLGGKHSAQRPKVHASEAALARTVPYDFARLKAAIAAEKKPVLLFIYTSWCPYCKKDFPLVNAAAKAHRDAFAFYLVSVDTDRGAFADFIAKQDIAFNPYIVTGDTAQADLEDGLQALGVHYKGGFPFFAAFIDGKPVSEIQGALEKEAFDGMLADIEAEARSRSSGRERQETRLENE